MKNRIAIIAIAAVMMAGLVTACRKTPQPLAAAELLNLGEKYLLELNYEQAIVEFTKLIEVEPKNPRAYTGLAEAYVGFGDADKAIEVLRQGLEQLPDDTTIRAMLDELTESKTPIGPESTPELSSAAVIQLERMPQLEFSIDGIVLGETDLGAAKSKYSSRPDYMSNLMGDNEEHNTEDTVYSMPYTDDDDPDNDMQFGYLFVQPIGGNSIQTMTSADADMLCLGKYRAGEEAALLLRDLCGLEDIGDLPNGENVFYDDGASKLSLNKQNNTDFDLSCDLDEKHLTIVVENNKILRFSLFTDDSPWNN